jgi:hypothetical protein
MSTPTDGGGRPPPRKKPDPALKQTVCPSCGRAGVVVFPAPAAIRALPDDPAKLVCLECCPKQAKD